MIGGPEKTDRDGPTSRLRDGSGFLHLSVELKYIIGNSSLRTRSWASCWYPGFMLLSTARTTMIDSERVKLLYGPYVPPKCRVGDKLPCEYRGREVMVRGMSDGLIQWPSTRRRGAHSLVLCGELIRAVERESEIAVGHHWGVRQEMVWKWRRALKVPAMTLGSRRLPVEYAAETLTPEVRSKARDAMHSPEVRAKLSRRQDGATGSSLYGRSTAQGGPAAQVRGMRKTDWPSGRERCGRIERRTACLPSASGATKRFP